MEIGSVVFVCDPFAVQIEEAIPLPMVYDGVGTWIAFSAANHGRWRECASRLHRFQSQSFSLEKMMWWHPQELEAAQQRREGEALERQRQRVTVVQSGRGIGYSKMAPGQEVHVIVRTRPQLAHTLK